MTGQIDRDGIAVFSHDPLVQHWAAAAYHAGLAILRDPAMQDQWLRHGGTWFVGVDALPSQPDGSIAGVPLSGAWQDALPRPATWHPAQLSVTYSGYPKQGPEDTDAAHRFRIQRYSGHVDGLRLENGRRFPREPHAFVVGFPLNETQACPLMVWPGSHLVMSAALRGAIGSKDPRGVDVTEAYKTARAQVFETIAPVPVVASPGQAIVLHRHMVHGIAPHDPKTPMPVEGRMMAYFRPEVANPYDWV